MNILYVLNPLEEHAIDHCNWSWLWMRRQQLTPGKFWLHSSSGLLQCSGLLPLRPTWSAVNPSPITAADSSTWAAQLQRWRSRPQCFYAAPPLFGQFWTWPGCKPRWKDVWSEAAADHDQLWTWCCQLQQLLHDCITCRRLAHRGGFLEKASIKGLFLFLCRVTWAHNYIQPPPKCLRCIMSKPWPAENLLACGLTIPVLHHQKASCKWRHLVIAQNLIWHKWNKFL